MDRARRAGWVWFAPFVLLAVFVAFLAGCATFGYQSTTVPVERAVLEQIQRRGARLYGYGEALYSLACTAPKPDHVIPCQLAAKAGQEARDADALIEDLKTRSKVIDAETAAKLIGLASKFAGLAGALFGIPIPTL